LKYKQELQARQFLQSIDTGDEIDEGEKRIQTPEEKVRKLLYQLLMEQKAVTAEEKQYLVRSVKLPEIRSLMADFF